MHSKLTIFRFLTGPYDRLTILGGTGFLCVVIVSLTSVALGQADRPYERPEAQVIKDQAQHILSQSEYRAQRTFTEWLADTLLSWAPKMNIKSRWGSVLFWIFITWCLLTLLAILIHFLWTVSLFIGGNRKADAPLLSVSSLESHFDKSYEDLLNVASQCARNHQYREAIGFQTLAVIKWLDALKILAFHASKTNGDYLREYQTDSPGRPDFQKIVRLSELALYAGTRCNDQTYHDMGQLMEHLTHAG
jgi:hypothetical protein